MSSTWPSVSALKCFCSPGTRHGMSSPVPITPFSATAATSTTRLPPGVMPDSCLAHAWLIPGSYGDGCLDPRVRVVALDLDVLEVEGVQLGDRRVEHQHGQLTRLAGELQLRLLEVVRVEVGVPERVHEVADLEA